MLSAHVHYNDSSTTCYQLTYIIMTAVPLCLPCCAKAVPICAVPAAHQPQVVPSCCAKAVPFCAVPAAHQPQAVPSCACPAAQKPCRSAPSLLLPSRKRCCPACPACGEDCPFFGLGGGRGRDGCVGSGRAWECARERRLRRGRERNGRARGRKGGLGV